MLNSEKISNSLNEADEAIGESSIDSINLAIRAMEKIEGIDTKYEAITSNLKNIYYDLQELSRDISNEKEDIYFDEQERNEVEERLDLIYSLKRKYGNNILEILNYKEEIEKDFLNKRLKQIAKLEAKLFKLTKKSSKRLSFAKVDKYTPEIDATIKEISDIYKEIDDNILKVKIKEQLKPNSTLFKALLLVGRNYSIAARFFMEEDSELTTIQLDKEIDELIYFTLNPSNTIITNLTIMDDNDIKEIIISNYRLFNVNLDSSTLESDIDNLINDLEKINIYHILNNFKIDILNLQSIKEGKKLLEKYNTQKDIE